MAQATRYTGKNLLVGLILLESVGMDSSAGKLYDGAVVGAPTFGAGKYGFGLLSVSDTDHIVLPVGLFNFGSAADWTIEAWLKGATAAARKAISSDTGNQIWIGTTAAGTLACGLNGTGGFANLVLDSAIDGTDGLWHHVAMVMTGGTSLKLFVDGALKGSETGTFTSPGAAAVGKIGSDAAETVLAWPGAIDEIAFWSNAKYTTTFTPPAAPHAADASGLLGYYQADHIPLEADYKSLTIKEGVESADGTAGSDVHEFAVPTYHSSEIAVELLKVTSDDEYYAAIAAQLARGSANHIYWSPEGAYTPGKPLYGVIGYVESVDTDIKFDDMVGLKFTFRGTEAIYDFDA